MNSWPSSKYSSRYIQRCSYQRYIKMQALVGVSILKCWNYLINDFIWFFFCISRLIVEDCFSSSTRHKWQWLAERFFLERQLEVYGIWHCMSFLWFYNHYIFLGILWGPIANYNDVFTRVCVCNFIVLFYIDDCMVLSCKCGKSFSFVIW